MSFRRTPLTGSSPVDLHLHDQSAHGGPSLSRRALLGRATAGTGAAIGARTLGRLGLAGGAGVVGAARAAGAAPLPENLPADFSRPLTFPPVITDAEVSLVAREAQVPLLQGPPTTMWTFDGTWPGPTIRRPSGERTTLTVTNLLPAEAGDITVHHHGGHQAAEHDGGPVQDPIARDAARTYVYELREDGEGERAATQWYHDHSHFRTGRNNWMGLQGMFILDDEVDAALGLPSGPEDLVLVCANREFTTDNQLADRFTAPGREEDTALDALPSPLGQGGYPDGDEVASIGTHFFVNGVFRPHVEVQARRLRLRLMNAANWYVMNLQVGDGLGGPNLPLVQVATEAGLMPAAVEREEVLLGPAERAEVILDLTGMAGQELYLFSSTGTASAQGLPGVWNSPVQGDFLQLRVVPADPERPDASRVVADGDPLRPLPDWADDLSTTPDRVWAFGLGLDEAGRAAWTVNGRPFDHDRVDAMPALDSTETWLLTNTTRQSHFIHIHDVDWVVLQRNGEAPPAHEAALKETFRVDPGEVVLVGSRFTDHTGPYMMHCHMLEHEDHGMMTTFEVVGAGEGDRVAHDSAEAAVSALVRGADAQAATLAVLRAARGGRPAPANLLAALNAPYGEVTGPPSQASLYCRLNDGTA